MNDFIKGLGKIYQKQCTSQAAEIIVKSNLRETINSLKRELPKLEGKEMEEAKEQIKLYRKILYT